jgi:mannosyltransferase OCH1-like enzyme
MSKLKRSALKSVVKECLLEILSEGINTQQVANLQPRGNAVAQEVINEVPQNEQSKSIKEAIAGITSDPILASVLGDTAQTTLLEQSGADRQGQMRQMRSSGSPAGSSDQFNEPDGESHWAALAFADKK